MSDDREHLVDNDYPDTFVCELSHVERLGCNRRLIFTVPDAAVPRFKRIVAKLIVPADYMVTLAYLLAGDGKQPLNDVTLLAFEPRGEAN